jgi:hypothetical protein
MNPGYSTPPQGSGSQLQQAQQGLQQPPQQQPAPGQPQQAGSGGSSGSGAPRSYPWTARRLGFPPPETLPKPGVAPPTAPSPSPFPRYGHAMPTIATASGDVYLFGGLVRETVRNDLYQFNSRDLSAKLVQTGGEIPSPRVGHAAAVVSSVLIVWGGDTKTDGNSRPGDKQDDGLYLLNLGMPIFAPHILRSHLIHVSNSLKRMDASGGLQCRSYRALRPCCNHGRLPVLRLRWAGGRRVPE